MHIVFNHGDSEAIMVESLYSNFRAPYKGFPHKNNKKTKNSKSANIQIGGLKTKIRKYLKEIDSSSFVIAIMDLDDCSKEMQTDYKQCSKKIFSFKEDEYYSNVNILPIFNDPNLDDVLRKLGYSIPKPLKHKREFYRKFFEDWDRDKFVHLKNLCKNRSYTNMDCLIEEVSKLNS